MSYIVFQLNVQVYIPNITSLSYGPISLFIICDLYSVTLDSR